jgi:hypothetical protein
MTLPPKSVRDAFQPAARTCLRLLRSRASTSEEASSSESLPRPWRWLRARLPVRLMLPVRFMLPARCLLLRPSLREASEKEATEDAEAIEGVRRSDGEACSCTGVCAGAGRGGRG